MSGRCLAGVAGLLFSLAAFAADLAVSPVRITLGPGHDRHAVSVANQGRQPVSVQAETVLWTQEDGSDRYRPTDELVVNPGLFTIAPGQTQILRLGLRTPADGSRETAYRLLLREIPAPAPVPSASPEGAGQAPQLQVLLQMRLPVYVMPARPKREARWHGQRRRDGSIVVQASNTGNVHMVVTNLALASATDAKAEALARLQTSTPVFPGQSREWRLAPERPLTGRIVLEATTDQGVERVPLDLAGY